jgi:hypothetical protein
VTGIEQVFLGFTLRVFLHRTTAVVRQWCAALIVGLWRSQLFEGWGSSPSGSASGIFRGWPRCRSDQRPDPAGRGWNIFVGAISLLAGVVIGRSRNSLRTLALVVGIWLIASAS